VQSGNGARGERALARKAGFSIKRLDMDGRRTYSANKSKKLRFVIWNSGAMRWALGSGDSYIKKGISL